MEISFDVLLNTLPFVEMLLGLKDSFSDYSNLQVPQGLLQAPSTTLKFFLVVFDHDTLPSLNSYSTCSIGI